VCVYGGKYFVPVRKSNQEAAGVKAGEVVKVTIAADSDIRQVEAPPEIAAVLARNKTAKARWEKLSYSNKKEHAEAILQAKRPETRERRLGKILAQLTAKQ
jgi:uncharacterized protein YdeI (YjbR/CyaY-like superfamily)